MGDDLDVVAAIDVGTNSVHMVVARLGDAGGFEVLTRHKESVRLGESATEIKELTSDAVDRAVAALRRCADIAAPWSPEVRAVATSAVREAHNSADLIGRAHRDAGIHVEIISGIEEARLIHLGVLAAVPVFDQTIVVCDIGGGSTEILVGRGAEILAVRSFKLGAIRLTQRFFPGGVVLSGSVEAARRYVRETILAFAIDAVDHRPDVMVGSSGTIETVMRMAAIAADPHGREPRSLAGIEISDVEIARVTARLGAAERPEDRAGLPGLDAARADIIVGGAVILDTVMETLGQRTLRFSEYALREGVLIDAFQRRTGASLHHLSDIRRRGIDRLMQIGDEDIAHSRKVAELAVQLFECLAERLGLADADAELLEAAALLCNVGVVIAHSKHHLHSAYVIRNAEQLVGFTADEIEVIAQVARYHRKSAPTSRHREFAALDGERQRVVRRLAALLRVAVGLDRSHRGGVGSLCATVEGGVVVISLRRDDGVGPDDLETEVHAAQERSALLSEVLDREVRVSAE